MKAKAEEREPKREREREREREKERISTLSLFPSVPNKIPCPIPFLLAEHPGHGVVGAIVGA